MSGHLGMPQKMYKRHPVSSLTSAVFAIQNIGVRNLSNKRYLSTNNRGWKPLPQEKLSNRKIFHKDANYNEVVDLSTSIYFTCYNCNC